MSKVGQLFHRFWRWVARGSLWIVSLGLMLASSGLDGEYMAAWMPPRAAILGYILNTTSDVATLGLMYWYGRLQMDASSSKRQKSKRLLIAEAIATLYSWFFAWRQLLRILPSVEQGTMRVPAFGEMESAHVVAPIAAGFIPVLLIAIGYAQALLAGRIEKEQSQSTAAQEQPQAEQAEAQSGSKSASGNGHSAHRCPWCDREFKTQQAVSAHLRFCDAYQAAQAEAQPATVPAPAPQQERRAGGEDRGGGGYIECNDKPSH